MDYIEYIKNTNDNSFEYFSEIKKNDIYELETKLNVSIGNEYKDFLLQCGSLFNGDSMILGIVPNADFEARGTASGDTLFARQAYNLDTKYIVLELIENENIYVYESCIGSIYSIDCYDNKLYQREKLHDNFNQYFLEFVDGLKE